MPIYVHSYHNTGPYTLMSTMSVLTLMNLNGPQRPGAMPVHTGPEHTAECLHGTQRAEQLST